MDSRFLHKGYASVNALLEGNLESAEHVCNKRRISSRLHVQLYLDQGDTRKAVDMANQTAMLQLQSIH